MATVYNVTGGGIATSSARETPDAGEVVIANDTEYEVLLH